jgi:acetoacetyl-CoA synthetase
MNGTNGDQANGTDSADLSIGLSKRTNRLWSHASPQSTPMYQFLTSVNKTFGLQLPSYEDLYKWSIEQIDDFWVHVWNFVGIRAESPASKVSCMDNAVSIAGLTCAGC